MNEPQISTAPPSVPGVPAGGPAVETVATGQPPDSAARSGNGENPAPVVKKPFGGNVGRKPHASGFPSGSPKAIEFDRKRDAERKRREREEKRLATPPPALPAATPPPVESVSVVAETAAAVAGIEAVDSVSLWTAEDFRQCAPELVELAEAWRIDTRTKQAVEGKLPRVVVEEIKKDAAFPPGSKKSLSSSSAPTLAKMFNALKVPIALKAVVTAAPALVYIIVRDLQTGRRIDKLIQDEAERRQVAESSNGKPV